MKKNMKKVISTLLALTFAAGMTACASPAKTPDAAAKTDAAKPVDAEAKPADAEEKPATDAAKEEAKPAGETKTITFWMWDKSIEEAYKSMIADFETKNPDIKVELSITPWADYWTKLQTALPSGGGPDVFWLNHPNANTYIPAGELMDLTPLNIDLSDQEPNLAAPYTMDGKVYGVPIFFDTVATFYNKKLFAEAGVPEPKDGWTWDDYIDAARKLTKKTGDEVTQYGCIMASDTQSGSTEFILQNGGKIFSDDKMSAVIDSPENKETIQWMLDSIYKDKISPAPTDLIETPADKMFANGTLAMMNTGLWSVKPFHDALGADAGIAPLPMKKQKASVFHNLAYCASSKTKNPDAVGTFMKYCASKESSDFVATVFLPANKASRQAWLDQYKDMNVKVFSDALEYGFPLQISAKNAGQVYTVQNNELEKVFNAPELGDGLATVQKAMNDEINK